MAKNKIQNTKDYKPSPIGMIPKDWEVEKVGQICDFIVPGRNKPTTFGGDIPWITTPDIKNNRSIYFSKQNLTITKEEAKSIGSKVVPKNSIIISCVGDLGLVAIAGNEMVINQQLHAFIPKENTNYKFLLYALSAQKKYMDRVATKTAVPYMNKDNCNSIPIPLPPLPEQRKIAQILSTWDESIETLETLIARKVRHKKALMQQLLTGKKRFKEFKGEKWKNFSLDKIAEIVMGQSPSSDAYNEESNGLPLIQGNADLKDRKTVPRIYTSDVTKECKIGDIILTVRAPVGAVAKSFHNACIGRGVCAIRAKNINNELLYYLLLEYEPKWKSLEQGSTFTAVNSADIKGLEFLISGNTKEQKIIASVISAADEEIQSLKAQLEHCRQQKRGLMQVLLTGQKRVKINK